VSAALKSLWQQSKTEPSTVSEVSDHPIFGKVIEINFFPHQKMCSLNCVYCNLGETSMKMNDLKDLSQFQAPEVFIDSLRERLKENAEFEGHILVSGNGEPTLYPWFLEFTESARALINDTHSSAQLSLQTNACHLDQKKVLRASRMYDTVYAKMDIGEDRLLKSIYRPLSRTNTDKLIFGLRQLEKVVLQSLFFQSDQSQLTGESQPQSSHHNNERDQIEDWIEIVGMIKPSRVHIYTIDQKQNGLEPLSEQDLEVIGTLMKRRLQIDFKVF
jgi:wyosine [tRNA(Phe)-imidazoG37] synthetase (radical SAM superfamily)